MKFTIPFFFFVFALFLFTNKSFGQYKKINTDTIKITEKDNGKTFKLRKHQLFDVTFERECVGCAKVWQITKMDTTKIVFMGKTHSNPSCTNCTGGRHDNTFHFEAKHAGKSTLAFEYFDKKFRIKILPK